MYNAEVISEPPTSWHDLMKPEYVGKTAMVYDVMGIMVHTPMFVTGTKTPTLLTRDELDATIDWLIKFKKEHALTITSAYGDLAALYASGEVIIAPAWTPTAIWAGPDAPKLDWVAPKEGMLVFSDVFSMFKDAPNMDLNYKILNHSLSPEVQANTANLIMTAVTVADAVPLLDEVPRNLYRYDSIAEWFELSGGPFPGWPIDPPEGIMSFDDIMEGWERFVSA
jgi:spermidine/putrescine transport system substrate-binding protein